MLALTLSGALCGLAGAILVFGSESHRFVTDGSSTGFTGSAGFNGIVAALFGALHPLWTIPASFLFGGLLVGANAMQREIQIPASLVVALNGIVVLFVVCQRRRAPAPGAAHGQTPAGRPALLDRGISADPGRGRGVSEFFTVSVLVATVASAVRLTTPYAFAALGETLGQRSGVLNLGVDGVMLLGAFFAYWVALEQQNLWLAVLAGAAVGAVMGVVYAIVTLVFHGEQGISGIGVYLFGLGFSELLYRQHIGTPLPAPSLERWEIPLLGDIPKVGTMFFNHSLLVYAAVLLVPLLALLINRTRFGLNVRAVGENPEAADSRGVSVNRTRTVTIVVANLLAGVGGAALALEIGTFQQNLTNGIGFIAVALVYFGSWRPLWVFAGSFLYGLLNATVNQLKTLGIVSGSAASLATAAPAVLTVAALVVIARPPRRATGGADTAVRPRRLDLNTNTTPQEESMRNDRTESTACAPAGDRRRPRCSPLTATTGIASASDDDDADGRRLRRRGRHAQRRQRPGVLAEHRRLTRAASRRPT